MSSKKVQRQSELYKLLLNQGKSKVTDLANQLHVTPETIRTDLSEMVKQNRIIREHGFARPISSVSEVPFQMREFENMQEKRKVAFRALQEVQANQTIFLDAGSTIVLGLPALPKNQNITIVTNGIPMAYEAGLLGFHVIVCSGELSNVGIRTYGAISSEILENLEFDLCILTCDGIGKGLSFATKDFHDVGIKRVVLSRSKRKIVAMDQSKFKEDGSYNFGAIKEFDCLVTNPLNEKQKKLFKDIKEIIEV